MRENVPVICRTAQAKYFLREDWTGIRERRPSGKSLGGKHREVTAAQLFLIPSSRERERVAGRVARSAGWGHLRKQYLHMNSRRHPHPTGLPPRASLAGEGKEASAARAHFNQSTNQLVTTSLRVTAAKLFLIPPPERSGDGVGCHAKLLVPRGSVTFLSRCPHTGCFSALASTGILRRRFPVAAKIALAMAGTIPEVPVSPIPPGGSELLTM